MKSEKITYQKQEFWARTNDLDDPKCREFTVFEDEGLTKPVVTENNILMVQKLNMRDAIHEWGGGGAGFAVWGGGSGRNFGNPSQGRSFYGRGFGFGSSNTGSGSNSMYTYDVKPLNQTLEPQNAGSDDGQEVIHIGSVVKGKVLGKKKHITGQIQSIEQDSTGNIKWYLVREPDTTKTHKIDPTAIFIWKPENESPHPGAADIPSMSGLSRTSSTRESVNPGYYPRLIEEYAGQKKVAKDIEKALKKEKGRKKSNEARKKINKQNYYTKLKRKNKNKNESIEPGFYPRLAEELSGSEAVYGFAAWLTGRDEKTVFSASDDAADIALKVGAFCEKNDLDDPVDETNGLKPKKDEYNWAKEQKHPTEKDLKKSK